MKLLITGGCGFLGSNLATHALTQGIGSPRLRQPLPSRLAEQPAMAARPGRVRVRARRHPQRQRRVARDRALQAGRDLPPRRPGRDDDVHRRSAHGLRGQRQHASTCSRRCARTRLGAVVIYSSTNKVYGDLEQFQYRETDTRYACVEQPNGFDEQTPLDFHSPYGCSKGSADQYLRDYHRIFGLKTVVFRHSSMYGGRQFATADQGWIGWFCQMAAQTRAGTLKAPFTISGNGKQVRDVLHAEDMISLYFSTLQHADAAAGQAFNIGGGIANSLSLLELFGLLEAEIGQPLQYTKLPPRESDQRVFVADIGKMERLTGWKPQVSAQQGVSRMLAWTSSMLAER